MPLEEYHPIDTLKLVSENIWIVDSIVIKMKIGLGFHIPFQTRMTVIRLQDGTLWVHSPTRLSTSLKRELNSIGEVSYLIAPNKIHYTYINDWKKSYPKALAFEAPGVSKRAQEDGISITFEHTLSNTAPSKWQKEIDQIIFRGSRYMDEAWFFHKTSKTLIVVDLIEKFELEKTRGFICHMLKLIKFHHPFGKTPPDLQKTFWGRKEIARQSLSTAMDWRPERLILAHGKWYPENALEELKRAFNWLI